VDPGGGGVGLPARLLEAEPGAGPQRAEGGLAHRHHHRHGEGGLVGRAAGHAHAGEDPHLVDARLHLAEQPLVVPVARGGLDGRLLDDLAARHRPAAGHEDAAEAVAPPGGHLVGHLGGALLGEHLGPLGHLGEGPPRPAQGLEEAGARGVVGRLGEDVALPQREAAGGPAGLRRLVEAGDGEPGDPHRRPLGHADDDGGAPPRLRDHVGPLGHRPVVAALAVVGLDAPPVDQQGVGIEARPGLGEEPLGPLGGQLGGEVVAVHRADALQHQPGDHRLLGGAARRAAAGERGGQGQGGGDGRGGASAHAPR
jgi:hypothetical protein